MTSVALTYFELATAAQAALERGLERVQVVVPRPISGSRRVRVLGGRKGQGIVWGEPCCEDSDGYAVVWVDAIDILAWLAAYAGVKVEVEK
jgi:hypothetical protein